MALDISAKHKKCFHIQPRSTDASWWVLLIAWQSKIFFQTRIWVFQKILTCRSSIADFTLDRHLSRCSSPAKSFLENDPEKSRKKCLLGLPRRWEPWEPWVWIHPLLRQRDVSELRCLWSFPSLWWSIEPCSFAFCKELLWPLQQAGYLAFPELQKISAAAIIIMTCVLYVPLKYLGTEELFFFFFLLHRHSQTTWRMCVFYSVSGDHWSLSFA